LKKQGIDIMTNASVESLDTSGEGVKAKVKTATGEVTLEADVVLSAVGIAANIEGIGLEENGVINRQGPDCGRQILPDQCTRHLFNWRLYTWPRTWRT